MTQRHGTQPVGAACFERPQFARARRLCLSLPETSEALSWGHPNFRVGRKTFCAFEVVKGRPSIAFRVTPVARVAALRTPHYFATPYGRDVWVSVRVDVPIDWKSIRRHIERSYRLVATPRLLAVLGRPTGRPR